MGFFTGANDALQELMIEQETRQRQKMLDAIEAEDRRSRMEDRKSNRAIQEENAKSLRASREQAADLSKQNIADKFEESTAMGTELDDAGAGILSAAGRGSKIKRTPVEGSLRVTAGLGAPTAENPLGLDTSTAPAAKIVDGKRLFAGTAKQQEEGKKRETRASYINSLPAGPERSYYEAQDAVGDTTPGAYVPPRTQAKPPSVLEYEYAKSQGYTGTYQQYQNEDANRRARAAKAPSAPQVFYGEDGKPHAIQFMPDGTSREVPLPAGMSGKIQPKKVKTPAEIEAERRAAARGTATGKADVAGSGGTISAVLGGIFGGGPQRTGAAAPAAAGAPPAIEEWVRDATGKMVRKQ